MLHYKEIFEPINQAIKPYDTEKILDITLNSRGAIVVSIEMRRN